MKKITSINPKKGKPSISTPTETIFIPTQRLKKALFETTNNLAQDSISFDPIQTPIEKKKIKKINSHITKHGLNHQKRKRKAKPTELNKSHIEGNKRMLRRRAEE